MTEMVRKQIYILKNQQAQIKRMAQVRGISEAAVIRQAIDHEIYGDISQPISGDRAAWEQALRFIRALPAREPEGEAYRWRREDAYAERLSRYEDHKSTV